MCRCGSDNIEIDRSSTHPRTQFFTIMTSTSKLFIEYLLVMFLNSITVTSYNQQTRIDNHNQPISSEDLKDQYVLRDSWQNIKQPQTRKKNARPTFTSLLPLLYFRQSFTHIQDQTTHQVIWVTVLTWKNMISDEKTENWVREQLVLVYEWKIL